MSIGSKKIISSTIFDEMSTKCRFDENKFDETSSSTKLPVDEMTCRRSDSRRSVGDPAFHSSLHVCNFREMTELYSNNNGITIHVLYDMPR